MTAILLACLAAAAFGAMAVAVRYGLRAAGEPELAPLSISLMGCVGLAVVAAPTGGLALDLDAAWPFAAIGAGVPGISQLLFVRAIRDAGPSRAAILIGTAPVLSALLAVAFLDEPLLASLAIATLLIVAGGVVLAWERERPEGFRMLGVVLALVCAAMFAGRDNLVRYAADAEDLPVLGAATASLFGATVALLLYLAIARRSRSLRRLPGTLRPYLLSAVCLAVAYGALIGAYDRGRVTVVAPLNATQSLWAVAIAAVLLRRAEAVGSRLLLAAALIVAGGALIGVFR